MEEVNNLVIVKNIVFIITLILAISLFFTSCWIEDGGLVDDDIIMNSHKEFVSFLNNYNSKNDGYVSSFISFDFESNSDIEDSIYMFSTVHKYKNDGFYDNNTFFTRITMSFYLKDPLVGEYKIKCFYDKKDVNFSDTYSFSIKQVDKFEPDYLDYYDERYYGIENNEIKYKYVYQFELLINNVREMLINISSECELSEDKLEEILELLSTNLTIINTWGE